VIWQSIPYAIAVSFGIALVTSLILTFLARPLALRVGVVDHPGPRKVHAKPMPLLGGVAMYLGAVLALVVSLRSPTYIQIFGILAGATLLLVVGLLDDLGRLHHQIKLMVAMPVAALILLGAGVKTEILSSILPAKIAPLANAGLTVFWVVGVTAAFSILDHMDGLCAGVAAIAAAFFAIFAIGTGQELVGSLAAAVFGASLGFLRWNFNPARIFMGDAGAMFLGFMLATLSLKLRLPGYPALIAAMVPLLILVAPVFDTLLISISRSRRGLIPFTSPGKDHTAHRLSNLGFGHRRAVLVIYGGALVGGTLALLAIRLPFAGACALAALLSVAALLAVASFERVPFERQTKEVALSATDPRRN
jgi:UDP-GlcNAc:undecaprenyl-phosphate/decaprenyl-phosphate GlcNAc-1-phosphate transferase